METKTGRNSMNLYGKALIDYHHGEHDAIIILHREDGFSAELPLKVFFAGSREFSKIEQLALECCRGNILDIGAGTGRHSLVLQERGFFPCALDISPEAVEIMKIKGVKNTVCADIFKYDQSRFDTLLMLDHGIGMTATLAGFRRFLQHAEGLLKPGGQLIFDSLDVQCTVDAANLAYHEINRMKNRYIGEIHLRFEYKGLKGEPWTWLHIDPVTMAREATGAGWHSEILHSEPSGDYLAKLTKLSA